MDVRGVTAAEAVQSPQHSRSALPGRVWLEDEGRWSDLMGFGVRKRTAFAIFSYFKLGLICYRSRA